jgi:hypothetical protein
MRFKLIGVVATVAAVALAVFAATGFGGDGPDVRSLESGYPTDQRDVQRVSTPSGLVDTSALGQASKKKGKVKLLFFETAPAAVEPGATDAGELPCPRGKAVTGYFLTQNTDSFLGASAPVSRTAWLVGVKNTGAAATQSIIGVVCATGVK